jgi:AbrB family looped-hinge helix DNA binding protein
MEEDMRVTTKGQVTIPLEIREQLSIHPGADVEFAVEGNVVRLVPTKRSQARGKRVVERLRGRATVRMTTDEILALTRGR